MSVVNVYHFVCASFPFGIEGWIWDLIVLVPGHCLYFLSLYLQTYVCRLIVHLACHTEASSQRVTIRCFCDLFVFCVDSMLVWKPLCGSNILNTAEAEVGFGPGKTSLNTHVFYFWPVQGGAFVVVPQHYM